MKRTTLLFASLLGLVAVLLLFWVHGQTTLSVGIVSHGNVDVPARGPETHMLFAENPQSPASKSAEKGEKEIPEHVFYEQVFTLLRSLGNARDYKEQAKLTDRETNSLERIADECLRQVKEQDAKAHVIIAKYRATAENLQPDESLPAPPPELKELQDERNAIILRHRKELRAAFGGDKFAKFDEAARRNIRIGIVPAQTSTP